MNPFTKRTIRADDEFRRIAALPKRTAADEAVLVERLTNILKTPYGTMRLRPIQALALYEFGTRGGLFAPIRVSGGKSLIALLAPVVVQSKKPILIVPASLKEKTENERLKLSKHWRVARHMRVYSYEELGRESKANEIDRYCPDLVILDEAHRCKNPRAGVTRRVLRYMSRDPRTKKAWEPGKRPKFISMSGTMLSGGTIKAFAGLLKCSLHEGAPIPLESSVLDEWAQCLDEKTNFTRPYPGPILQFATPEDRKDTSDETIIARRGFRRRLVETPGVISTQGEQVSCSLNIRGHVLQTSKVTDENFRKLRGDPNDKVNAPGWETPDGWPLSMAAEVWRVSRELSLGMHGIWTPRPPKDWLVARKNWFAFVRNILARTRTLDTMKQVATECRNGRLSTVEYDEWMRVKDSYRIRTKDVWHDTTALEWCESWLSNHTKGIVWVDHIFFGEELERRTGVEYFREEGQNKAGQSLETLSNLIKDGKAKVRPVIASTHACQAGFNLQPWNENLITAVPPNAKTWEQLLGRTHRDGQEADEVNVDVLFACAEHVDSWERSLRQAEMAKDAMGDEQKILMATLMMPAFPSQGWRWERTTQGTSDSRDGGAWWDSPDFDIDE